MLKTDSLHRNPGFSLRKCLFRRWFFAIFSYWSASIVIGTVVLLLVVGLSGCVEKGENILLNSGFEEGNNGEPLYWIQATVPVDNLTMLWDNNVLYNGSRSAGIKNIYNYPNATCNNWAQQTNKVPIGKTLELSGWIKTIDSEDVVMVIQCLDKYGNYTGFGTTEATNEITGTNDWNVYTATVFVPMDTKRIVVRLFLCGTGEAWFDDVKLIVK